MEGKVSLQAIEKAFGRIKGHVHMTQVLSCSTLNMMANQDSGDPQADYRLVFKCENFQKTGSFKARGACNAILQLKEEGHKGVVTHSSGNHGQAVAYASSSAVADLDCIVVVPKETPSVKKDAIKGYGAKLVICDHPTQRYIQYQ